MWVKYMHSYDVFANAANHVAYDKESGILTWKKREPINSHAKTWNTRFGGKKCGSIDGQGYIRIRFNYEGKGIHISAHRLVFFIENGYVPDGEIDHINMIKDDNRIQNLRVVTTSINQRNVPMKSNNSSGFSGVYWKSNSKKWCAQVGVNNKKYYLGLYDDIVIAHNAVRIFMKNNGFTEKHGEKP